ncbi:MAG: type II secretion system major pseudopilin GspG [Robiginitomaculum sp.]|nr:type II secretion system major pseudopilin GspG [Robiginitomaculum sp.]
MRHKMDNTKQKSENEDGFTLVEVMVTMVIIGLLTTFVVINVLPAQDKAMQQKAKTDISTLEQAIEMYKLDMGKYPESLDDLRGGGADSDARYRKAGYIKFLPDDPWGNPYEYAFPGDNGIIDIWTYGADGEEGGEGLNADIGNWQQ